MCNLQPQAKQKQKDRLQQKIEFFRSSKKLMFFLHMDQTEIKDEKECKF